MTTSFYSYLSFTAHFDLYFLAGILHRDVSLWNLMLENDKSVENPDEETPPKLRRGLLIDLDYAWLISLARAAGFKWDLFDNAFVYPEEETDASYPEFRNAIAARVNQSAGDFINNNKDSLDQSANFTNNKIYSQSSSFNDDTKSTSSKSSTETVMVDSSIDKSETEKKNDDPFTAGADENESDGIELLLEEDTKEETKKERSERH